MDTLAEISGHFAAKWLDSGFRNQVDSIAETSSLPQFEWVSEISARLQNLRFNKHQGKMRIIDFEQNQYLKGLEHITTFFNAIHNQRALMIRYAPFGEKDERQHTFHPYYLKQYNLRWFVFGVIDSMQQLTNLALDRVINVEESQISYVANHKFDFDEYFEDIVGVTVPDNGIINTVIIAVKKEFMPYMQTKPLHGSQTNLETTDNEGILSFKVIINYELISKLLSFGDNIRVIEPQHLAERIRDKINSMAVYYNSP
ncbi:helix-turn-helix transcriptional regulator [Pedobacter sp. GR22-6]|uniref:helix-turn-helix transcriptional regulator n=1 Tax=Pedobacter sp. GR22-6 TaxID=3127957 RepID=UPI00307DF7E1